MLSGISFSLAAYSYQFWIPMFPLYFLQAYRLRISLKRFLTGMLITASILQASIFAQHGFKALSFFIKAGGPEYVSTTPSWLSFSSLIGIFQGWIEFFVFAFLPLLGLAFSLKWNPAK